MRERTDVLAFDKRCTMYSFVTLLLVRIGLIIFCSVLIKLGSTKESDKEGHHCISEFPRKLVKG